jgi:hypothetical protein
MKVITSLFVAFLLLAACNSRNEERHLSDDVAIAQSMLGHTKCITTIDSNGHYIGRIEILMSNGYLILKTEK